MYCAPSHSTCRHVGSVGARADCFPHIGKRCRCVGCCTDVPEIEHLRPCRDTGSLPLPVEFGGALNLFLPRHRAQEVNADASGTAQANVDALATALMCPSRGSTYAPCAEVGTLPLTVEGGRARKLFAQVIITPNHDGYWQRHHRYVHHRVR